jgi:electron transfer flavoprotein beta subunit
MNIFVLLKLVPDTVEELEIAPDGTSLDAEVLRFKPNDPDEHAVEQALLLKEKHGATVTVVALDSPEVDDVLFTSLAKGADRAVKLTGDLARLQSAAAAKLLADFLQPPGKSLPPDSLVLVRGQSIDDLEGEIGPYLAEYLRLPYASVVTRVTPEGNTLTVMREFAGGLRGEFSLPLPAVVGIQSAEKPPRYVPIAKVRAAMKSAKIETLEAAAPDSPARVRIERLSKPVASGRAQILEGSPEEAAAKIVEVLVNNSLV